MGAPRVGIMDIMLETFDMDGSFVIMAITVWLCYIVVSATMIRCQAKNLRNSIKKPGGV